MTKNAQYLSKIRSFYAKNTFKREGQRWVKQYEAIPGIVIVRCTVNNKVYFAKATNIRRTVSRWRSYIRAQKTNIKVIDEDIARYGIDSFTVTAGEALRNVPEEFIELRLNILFRSYVRQHQNTYNKYDVIHRYIPLFERTKQHALGGVTGRNNQLIDRTADIKGPVIYVITNKQTKKRLVCGVQDFERSWFTLHSQLRQGTFRIAELQKDWMEYGEAAFVADFYRCDRDDLRKIKSMVLRSFDDLYGHKREKNKAGSDSMDHRGKLAG